MNDLSLPILAGDAAIKHTRHTAEQIIRKFETTEQLIAEGKPVAVLTPFA